MKMFGFLRPRSIGLACARFLKIGNFVQVVQRFSADCEIREHSLAFFRRYDLANG
jgi:hypothetical protein